MKLSVVIVSYNVKYFLEQCLYSVIKAGKGIEMEVIVVDNNSVDGSILMIKEKFPEVYIIENIENKGFSKANNQAITYKAQGEYILLLNPDTVVEESTFRQVIDFMDKNPEAGGLGVKMLDGKGRFLPESKRGFPTPKVAFYKMFGLSKLFPKSKSFGKYHLGYLDQDEIHEVEILSGAFMLLRKSILEKIGLLDESFFMYGEDIDLSYRIIEAGYKNYYFPKTRIIHYKGESTKKSSINYVIVFYKAMIIFAKKHFSKKNAKILSMLINLAIYIRAFVAVMERFVKAIFLPVFDSVLVYIGLYYIKNYWEQNVVFSTGGEYPIEFVLFVLPVYILVWLLSVLLSGGYDKPIRINKIVIGIIIGTVIILIIYALLSEHHRFSRALIILGATWAIISMVGLRYLLNFLKIKPFKMGTNKNRRIVIVGDLEETIRIENLLQKTLINPEFLGLISSEKYSKVDRRFVGNLSQLEDIINIYKIDEIIFCSKSLTPELIIDLMTKLQYAKIEYKIAPPESLSIIGSNSINTSGELYMLSTNSISKISNKRSKRVLDILLSIIFLAFYPIEIFFVNNQLYFLKNIFKVMFGVKSWVGFYKSESVNDTMLPFIKCGILDPVDSLSVRNISKEISDNLNILYAKDYRITNDLNIIIKGFSKLGRK